MATTRPITLEEYLTFVPNISIQQIGLGEDVKAVTIPSYATDQIIPYELIYSYHIPGIQVLAQPVLIASTLTKQEMHLLCNKLASAIGLMDVRDQFQTSILYYSIGLNGNQFDVLWVSALINDASYEDILLQLQRAQRCFTELSAHIVRLAYKNIEAGQVVSKYANPVASVNYVREVMSQTV